MSPGTAQEIKVKNLKGKKQFKRHGVCWKHVHHLKFQKQRTGNLVHNHYGDGMVSNYPKLKEQISPQI
jgi:hypothetical protein